MNHDVAAGRKSTCFTVADLEYELPEGLIAQHPLPRRDDSRLLTLDRAAAELRDGTISELPKRLRPGDLLVLNDTKVLPARFSARRGTGGKVGGLFVREVRPGEWEVMLEGSRRLRVGECLSVLRCEQDCLTTVKLTECLGKGLWRVGVDPPGPVEKVLERIGTTPLPPYIRRDDGETATDSEDRQRYQTVYARRPGAIAAPTAGLHLTRRLLDELRAGGVETAFVTLHVGVGTFRPIDVPEVSQHRMHAEWYDVASGTAEAVRRCRRRGGRVVAVGTTSVRVLESCATATPSERLIRASSGMTNVFIYPPYEFRVVDALLTNFHLPRSTLLALVMALAGVDNVRGAYAHAMKRTYRFYSYGDAMLIL
jgi:S-adenosylmethionine:tRNA ribosyltransferase-isomerase